MKAKYLFYSLALASAFTACTQEELFEAPALESNEVADRPVAGVVTFVNDDEVDSRYNRQDADFENGDELGLYLMDSFDRYVDEENNVESEAYNRNDTYWQWQSCWWDMYKMENYISSNYAYVYNKNTEEWENHASRLVEGNYIALFPQNKYATNRAELWHPIKANVDLVPHTTKKRYYVNRDNQFFVGYEQIHRDQEQVAGKLTAKISMKPILTYARMKFDNNQADKIRLKKVVFTKANKDYLPNVAFIEPAEIVTDDIYANDKLVDEINPIMDGLQAPYWAWSNREAMAEYDASSNCGVEGDPYRQGKYDRTTFTHAAARSMVRYATTGKVPYGFDAEKYAVSKEYTFNFPGDGVILNGNEEGVDKTLTRAEISIALPAFEGWNNMKVVVYADRLKNEDADDEEWVSGYISSQSKATTEGLVNADWNLESLSLWDNDKMKDFGTVELRIDDEYFVALNEIEVNSSDDFFNLVKGRLADANTAKRVDLTVKPYNGTTLNVNADVVNLIDAYEAKHGSDKVNITFTGKVKLNAANSIHKFKYAGVEVELGADQEVTEKISYSPESTNASGETTPATGIFKLINNKTLTVLNDINTTVDNKGTMIVKTGVVNNKTMSGYVATLDNNGFLTLNAGANVGTLNNNAGNETEVEAGDGSATVVTLNNNNGANKCDNCAKAVLNVMTGTLNVTDLTNNAIVNVESTLNVSNVFNNSKQHTHADGVLEAIINNNGVVNGVISNEGTINNGNAEGKVGKFSGDVYNTEGAVINAYEGEFLNLIPSDRSVLNVFDEAAEVQMSDKKNSKSYVIFKGVVAQDVDTRANDIKIFELAQEERLIDLMRKMIKTGSTYIKTDKNIIFEEYMKADGTYDQEIEAMMLAVEYIYVDGTDVVFKEDKASDWVYKLSYATVEVSNKLINDKPCKLSIKDETKIKIKEAKNAKLIHVANGSSLVDAGGDEIDHNYNP